MKGTTDPWRELEAEAHLNSEDLSFEDSFVQSSGTFTDEKRYVPLDDSQEYLASLEKKLARIQGKTLSRREDERRRLISALVQSKETHAMNLMNSDQRNEGLDQCQDQNVPGGFSMNTVDPQGTLGYLMKKCAPEHVALSPEELLELVKGDVLSTVHDGLYKDDRIKDDQPVPSSEASSSDLSDSNV